MTLVEQVHALAERGDAAGALSLTERPAASPNASLDALTARALALKASGRVEEALKVYQRAARAYPRSAVAEHNVAALLGDLHRSAEAVEAAERARQRGGDAPETWLVYGRALQGVRRFDEARAAFEAALARRPGWHEPLRDLAQLIWMRTADADAALAPVEAALRRWPHHPVLTVIAATVESYTNRGEAAYARVAAAAHAAGGSSPDLEMMAAGIANGLGRADLGLEHAGAVLRMERTNAQAAMLACDAWLGLGQPDPAARMAERLLTLDANDQQALARLATAWRLMGDPRASTLYDYDAFVRAYELDTPAGWPTLDAYLADLVAALHREHQLGAHPFDQSLRGGVQTPEDLRSYDDPAIVAFYRAIDGPIRRHMAALGQGSDPHRRRNTGAYKVAGAWSVKLQPNGYHVEHIHPMGWLSSACYLEVPPAVDEPGHTGWIRFGKPGIPTTPALDAERHIKPRPGMLVLFPSYMWHGTVPFSGETSRLTAAFDVIPA